MNVSFLSTNYYPTQEERRVLDKLQERIHYRKVEYLYNIRHESPRMIAARKEEMHLMWRSRWEVIEGDLEA